MRALRSLDPYALVRLDRSKTLQMDQLFQRLDKIGCTVDQTTKK